MAKQNVTVELFYNNQWNTVPGPDVYQRDGITITRGRQNETSQPAPMTASLTFGNKTGKYNPKNPTSALYGKIGRNTPLRITVGSSVRFIGEVSSWTPRRALDNNDAWVKVVASSQLRRFSQGEDPFRNSLDRWIRTKSPVGYWPLDDPEGSTHARAVVGQDIPLTGSSLFAIARGWSEGRTFPWLGSAYRFRINNFFRSGPLSGGGDISALAADIVYMHQPGPNLMTGISLRTTDSSSNATDWFVSFDLASGTNAPDTAEISVLVNTFAGPILLNTTGTSETLIDGNPHHVRFLLTQSGANVTVSVLIDGSAVSLGSSTVASTQVGRVDRGLTLYTPSVAIQDGQVDISNFVIWYSTIPSVADAIEAMRGYSTETTVSRIIRLSQEEGISLQTIGSSINSAALGPQYPDTFLSIIREAATTDAGILLDRRSEQGVLLRTLDSLYNHDPTLALDFSNEELAEPLEPIIDDFDTRNDVTVTRRDGGSYRAVLESGPMSVQPLPDGVGRTKTQVEVNAFSDLVLADQAGWRLHLGTVDEIRFPQITVDLDRHPELVTTASALDVGDRILANNLPDDITPDIVNLLVQGYTETIYSHRRKIIFTCSPENPYHIAEVEHSEYSYIGSDGTIVDEAFASGTDTKLKVYVRPTYPIWDDGDQPFDIESEGVRLTLTDVASGVRDTFTRTVSNGWGSSDTGESWTNEGGLNSDYSVSGGKGIHLEQEAGGATRRTLFSIGKADLEAKFSVSIPEISSGTAAQAGLIVREDGTNNNFYVFRVLFLTNGNLDLRISKRISGTETTLANPTGVQGSYIANTVVHMRCLIDGNVLAAKLWTGSSEPVGYQVTAKDSDITSAGRIGLRSAIDPGWTGSIPLTFSYDNFEIVNYQEFTVTQTPVNGVTKTIPVGSSVDVFHKSYIGL